MNRKRNPEAVGQTFFGWTKEWGEGDAVMRAEKFANRIPFRELERLRNHGIKVEIDGSAALLVDPAGNTITAKKDDCANAEFSGNMTKMVENAIAREWHIDSFPHMQRNHVNKDQDTTICSFHAKASPKSKCIRHYEQSPVEQDRTLTLASEMSHG